LVEASSCSEYVHKLQIENYILLGKGERMNDGRGRETILADLFEAVIGAIYLDGGIEAARHFLFSHFSEDFTHIIEAPTNNWKAELQDYMQKEHGVSPKYTLISEKGPDHSKTFEIAVFLHEQELGRGLGSSKKEAQQAAAAAAFQSLNIQP
jgi:ribonuclease-3